MEAERELDLTEVVSKDPSVHSGDLVFTGTRVPAHLLPECLKSGDSLEQFLQDYPTVERRQAERLLELGLNRVELDVDTKKARADPT